MQSLIARGFSLVLICCSVVAAQPDPATPAATTDKTLWERWQAYFSEEDTPVDFFKRHFHPYDPIYFVWLGGADPTSKFQYSFKYSLFDPEGKWATKHKWLRGPHFAFTQTSLWDLGGQISSPFLDSSYKPEAFYAWERLQHEKLPDWIRIDLQGGFQHESNGKSPPDSRSLNILYFQPSVTVGNENRLNIKISPRFWFYVVDLNDNPDLPFYRGYMGGRVTIGYPGLPQISGEFRVGDEFNRGSMQLDATMPLTRLTRGNMNLYLHLQYFNGWGESLLRYNQRDHQFRVGLALTR